MTSSCHKQMPWCDGQFCTVCKKCQCCNHDINHCLGMNHLKHHSK